MLARFFALGGPVMYAILAIWVIVVAGILDRGLYSLGSLRRRPFQAIRSLARAGDRRGARRLLRQEQRRAGAGITRIETVSQLATSVGLFGTVLGIARAFFARGADLGVAAPEVLASGLATALFTTIAGLIVFLVGAAFVFLWQEWQEARARSVVEFLEGS